MWTRGLSVAKMACGREPIELLEGGCSRRTESLPGQAGIPSFALVGSLRVLMSARAEFTITDDYSDPNAAHKIPANAWVGTTEFEVEKINEDVGEKKAGKLLSLAPSERRSVVAPVSGTP